LLLRHPELVAEAEEITSALLVVEIGQELADEVAAKLRTLGPSAPVFVDTGRGGVLEVLGPYINDLTRRTERGARRAAHIAIAVITVALDDKAASGTLEDQGHGYSDPRRHHLRPHG
jgi:hypothetical protein